MQILSRCVAEKCTDSICSTLPVMRRFTFPDQDEQDINLDPHLYTLTPTPPGISRIYGAFFIKWELSGGRGGGAGGVRAFETLRVPVRTMYGCISSLLFSGGEGRKLYTNARFSEEIIFFKFHLTERRFSLIAALRGVLRFWGSCYIKNAATTKLLSKWIKWVDNIKEKIKKY